jgi:hypothetical protein
MRPPPDLSLNTVPTPMIADVLANSYFILIADAVGDGDTDTVVVAVLDEDDEGDVDSVTVEEDVLDVLAPDDSDGVGDTDTVPLTDTDDVRDSEDELVADCDTL